MSTSKHKKVKARDFDNTFDLGEDVSDYLDLSTVKAQFPTQRISIDFPKNIIEGIDLEAAKIGVTRTALIKIWIAEHLAGMSSRTSRTS